MEKKLGLGTLTALVIGSMIGAGVFSLPQNMAAVASPLAVMIGWIITGIGMIFLALSFQYLAQLKPEIESGVFGYAQAGFGHVVGFFSAWGYWFSAMLANVSYLVIVFGTLGLLFDQPDLSLFGAGNTFLSLIGSSILLWSVHALVLRGIQTAATVNLITTCAKLIPLGVFIVFACIAFRWHTFTFDFSGFQKGNASNLLAQIKSTMLITVWVFIGIEGAVIVSKRAKHRRDIGRATILGLITALFIYVSVTLLSMGVVKHDELAQFANPSMAQVLTTILGPAGTIIIGIGLLISVCGAFLSWTVLTAEVPFIGAQDRMFPQHFTRQNRAGTPVNSLLLTNGCIQVCLVIVYLAGSTYDTLLVIASEMILVPYLLVGAYTLKLAYERADRGGLMAVGLGATCYGLWLLYASGLYYLLLSAILYVPGLFFYLQAKKEQGEAPFNHRERMGIALLIITATLAGTLLWQGVV